MTRWPIFYLHETFSRNFEKYSLYVQYIFVNHISSSDKSLQLFVLLCVCGPEGPEVLLTFDKKQLLVLYRAHSGKELYISTFDKFDGSSSFIF